LGRAVFHPYLKECYPENNIIIGYAFGLIQILSVQVMRTHWSKHFERLSDTIQALIERARSGANDATIKGTCLEVIICDTLRKYLPSYFNMGTGQVANSHGKLTPQLDIVVYDGNAFPHLAVNEDSSVVICCESLLVTVECKIPPPKKADLKKHYDRFCVVESARHSKFQDPELKAGYFVLIYESFKPDLDSYKDKERSIGFYCLQANKSWWSEYGQQTFLQHDARALERFFENILMDCMRRGQLEIGSFEDAYEVIKTYVGW
jgi:hypothetical protein